MTIAWDETQNYSLFFTNGDSKVDDIVNCLAEHTWDTKPQSSIRQTQFALFFHLNMQSAVSLVITTHYCNESYVAGEHQHHGLINISPSGLVAASEHQVRLNILRTRIELSSSGTMDRICEVNIRFSVCMWKANNNNIGMVLVVSLIPHIRRKVSTIHNPRISLHNLIIYANN